MFRAPSFSHRDLHSSVKCRGTGPDSLIIRYGASQGLILFADPERVFPTPSHHPGLQSGSYRGILCDPKEKVRVSGPPKPTLGLNGKSRRVGRQLQKPPAIVFELISDRIIKTWKRGNVAMEAIEVDPLREMPRTSSP